MKNLSESILHNIHKSEDINIKQLKLFEESGVVDDVLSRKLDTICNEVRISGRTILRDVDWKTAGENSFYIMPEIDDDDEDDEESLESLEDTIIDVATKYFPEAEVYKEGSWYLLQLYEDEDDFLVESVSRNSRKESKNVSHNLNTKSRRKAKKLNEGEKYSYITGANDYEDVYNSEANTDVLFILKELERYFNESSEFVKNVMSSDEAINYQFPSGEANMLKQSADKIAEVRNAIDKWYSEKY